MRRTALALVTTVVFGAAVLLATHADAQGARNCGPRESIVERLLTRYGETRQTIGLGADNSVVEVYASVETGTWTILVTLPSGLACLVAAGQSFENLAEAPPPTGKDA